MSADDIKLPPLARPQVPRVEADVSLIDIKVLARWCERTATEYARAAIQADRARRAPSPQGDAEPARYVVLKASGSRYAYVNDTQLGVTVRRFDVLKGDGWGQAESLAARLNGIVASSTPAKGGEQE